MDLDILKKQLDDLKAARVLGNKTSCLQIISVINEYFDVPKSLYETKYAVELLLKDSEKKNDLLKFIIKVLYVKDLHDAVVKIFEIIHKIISMYAVYVKAFSKVLSELCLQCLKFTEPSARFKEMAVKTISEMIEKDILDESIDIENIIEKLMSVLDQDVKNRLFSHIYELLGMLSKKHPEKFSYEKAVNLRNKMLTAIQKLFKDDKASYSLLLVSGAVGGLKDHLYNFAPKDQEDDEFNVKLYECMSQLSDPNKHQSGQSNRVAFRNMLEILHLYGYLVSEHLFKDYLKWHKVLLMWISSKLYEDKNAGVQAFYTFHNEIALNLERRKKENDKAILLFFMNFFQKTLESPKSEPHEIRIAIKGFGSMASACKILLEPKYLTERFDLVMQRTEYSYYVGDKMRRREVLEHLPSYVEALSKIMNQLDEISGIQLHSLQSVLVILIKDFHFLSTSHHGLVAIGLLETFVNLQKSGGKILDDILESVIWQGILWTCSHQSTYDLKENIDNIKDWKEAITYQRYLPLWRRILTPQDEKYELISRKIYQHFIKNLFLIIDKLDLSTKKRKYQDESTNVDVEFYFTDPSLNLEPIRAENFQILYNLVDFYQDILVKQTNEQLEKYFLDWMELWIENSVKLSYKHSLISAFMHFIEISLSIMERTSYTSNTTDILNKHNTIETVKAYVRTLFPRCQQISGELQVACLELIFKTPTFILIDHTREMGDIFIIGFTVGKSYLKLAECTLTCFESFVDALSDDSKTRRSLLEKVLPSLEAFLSTSTEMRFESELKILKYHRQKSKAIVQTVETDLMKIKKKILLFLGSCSPNESQLILCNYQQKLIKDYISDIFRVKLECDESSSPIIYLDQIIDRICKLSLNSSDRSTKISACELLHGLVLYMMGKNLERKESLQMWRNLCKTIITLGADKDQTVRQLFEPLLIQIMHHYSQPNKILSPLSTVLMETVMEMLSHKESGIQDLSARLIREYIIWLMRQTSQEQRKISPVRLVDFFYELRKMSIDTDQSKRLAATLGFNNIYRIVREEESLVNVYWIYLLDIFCTNFRSTEGFSEDLDIYFVDYRRFEQVSASLDHLTRVFVERSEIFHQVNSDRIIPEGFRGMTLRDVLNWLFEQCSMPQYHYRRKCMEIFLKILSAYNTKDFYYQENLNFAKILQIGDTSTEISKYPNLNHLNSTQEPIYKITFKWLKKLHSALDFYHWIVEHEIIPNEEVTQLLSKTVVIESIEYFLKQVTFNDMVNILRTINESLINNTQASMELKMHNRNLEKIDVMKNLILMTILDFLKVLMQRKHSINNILLNNKDVLIKLIKMLVFKPQRLNFDFKTLNVVRNFQDRLTQFIIATDQHGISPFNKPLMSTIQNKIMKYFNELCHKCDEILSSKTVLESQESKLSGIILIITNILHQVDNSVLAHNLILQSAELLLSKIFDGIVEKTNLIKRPRYLTPNVKRFATNAVRVCLKIDPFLSKLVSYSFNSESLKISDTCSIQKGESFLQTFKKPIFETFTSKIGEAINLFMIELDGATEQNKLRIFNILSEINEYIYEHHSQNQKLLEDNFAAIKAAWTVIMENYHCMENKLNCADLTIINLATRIAMICPYELTTMGGKLENFKKWLLDLFKNRNNSFEIKSKGIFLIPCITDINDESNHELMESLNEIQKRHIPIRSTEFPEGSLERSSLVSFSKVLFQALLTSKSPTIYRFILNITVNDEKYILEEKLQQTQMQLMKSLTEKKQDIFLNQTFEIFFLNENYDPEIRLSLVKRYLLTILKSAHADTILAFIKLNISKIIQLIDCKFDDNLENGQWIINRCGGYMIIEGFAATVPKEKIESAIFSYNGNSNNGLALIKELIMKAKDVRRDVIFMVEDRKLQELFRKFQCYCYRALASLVANTKDNPEIFNICLFQENQRSYIWRKLINVVDDNLYSNWAQDFEEYPKVKQYIISIKDMDFNAAEDIETTSKKYIKTVSIFDKSLSQTLTKTDLSYSVVLSNREVLERSLTEQQKNMSISLESIPINDHEVMSTMIGIVNTMFSRKLTVYSDFKNADRKKYEWILSLANSLKNPDQHKNVKIFLVKLIENCRHIFSYYAEFLLAPILCILTDGTFGDSLSFFMTDLIAMLLSWSKVYKPKESDEIKEAAILLKFLMKNAYHERNEIFKLNLELIKKVIETWNEILVGRIPIDILLGMLKKPTEESQNIQLICGIQINAVVFANNLTPWTRNDDQQCLIFFKAILTACENSNPKIYQAASQLMGLCLNVIAKANQTNTSYKEMVIEKLEKLQAKRDKTETFFQLLYGIHKEFPAILDTFMSRIASAIPTAIRKNKCMYLEMFLARFEVFKERAFLEISSINIKYLIKQNEYQLLALHIINKGIDLLSPVEFMKFFDDLVYLATSPNDNIKSILYEIMIYSIQKYSSDPKFDKQKPMKVILGGFNDSDPQIQNRVVKYFNENSGLSKSFKDRFRELLTSYYEPQLEKHFLQYSTQLLLEIPIHHPRSTRCLLDYDSRDNTNFFEYPIITKSSNTQGSLTPMFIQSQQRQLLAGDGSQYNSFIRATQLNTNKCHIFSPTHDPNKMTQASQSFSYKQTQNSLFVSLKPQYLSLRSQATSSLDVNIVDDLEMQIQSNKEKQNDSLDYLRQRIVKKSTNEASRHYAMLAIEKRDYGEASRRKRLDRLREGKEVVLYRRYRLGDFPDFFFNSLAILMPLQALVKKDDIIARHIYISIFESIINTFQESHDEETRNEFYTAINEAIVYAMKNSKECNPLFMSSLIQLAIVSEKFLEISPKIISTSIPIPGILFLESQLIRLMDNQTQEVQQVAKRVKLDENEVQIDHWMRLIDLYYKVNEYEVINGIFTEKLKLKSMVKINLLKAIDLELNNQYKEAYEIYKRLIQEEAFRNQNEKDFYYNSYFNCLANLSDWDQIAEKVQSQFDSYDEIWNEQPFHQNTLLPMLLKGELHKILNNEINEGFISILEEWFDDEKKYEYLHKKFPEEIGMINITDENYAACGVDMEKSLQAYSDEWSCLEIREDKLRLLKACRNIAEITNFVDIMTLTDEMAVGKHLDELYKNWRCSLPHRTDSILLWNDLIAYRKMFLAKLRSKYEIDDQTIVDSEAALIDIKRNLLNIAFKQNNLDAAKYLVSRLRKELNGSSNENILKFNLAIGKYKKLYAEHKYTIDKIILMKKLGHAWELLKTGVLSEDLVKEFPVLEIDALCTTSEISWSVFKLYRKVDPDALTEDINEGFKSIMDVIDDDSDIMQQMLKYSENSLKTAKNLAQKFVDQDYSPEKELMVGETYFKLGQFYRNVFVDALNETKELQLQMMKSIFSAISYGSDEARVLIPYILQLPALKNNEITKDFNEQLNMVPEWMFLPYISQIMSSLDFENDCYMDQLILKLAKKYPNALYFPFALSRDHFRLINNNQVMEKSLINDIYTIISNPTINNFASALQCIVVPEKFIETHLSEFFKAIKNIRTNDKYIEAVENFHSNVFDQCRHLRGSEFDKKLKVYDAKILALKKINWEKDTSVAKEKINQIHNHIEKNIKSSNTRSIELRKLCNWLSEYKWNGEANFLEIPGQYSGKFKPFIESHVKIVRFEQNLNVFNSKQRPIEIKIYGSDGKIYNFIVKYGEDLRQDERIQHALRLMSDKLALDKNCAQNQLKINTYEVIPVNSTCGILQIVNNGMTIFDFMQDISRQYMVQEFSDLIGTIRQKYQKALVGDGLLFAGFIDLYEKAVLNQDREQLISKFTTCEKMIPNDIIQRSLQNIAITLEAYYILRKNFITSLASMNIGHYLLGIGDRHLSNIMIDMTNGRLIGIDFGIAFGTAPTLAIPELIPFRLTSHFTNVMEPMGVNGLIKKNMIHTLNCFRNNKEALLIFLEVFVKEPTIDWLSSAKTKSVGNTENAVETMWNPEKRIDIVRRKIDGENPTRILCEELSSGKIKSKETLYQAYLSKINGNDKSFRAKFKNYGSDPLTIEDQITCLIDIATDKELLAITYLGWDAWF